MSQDRPSAGQFWSSVAVRLAAVVLAAGASVAWFQGCLVPIIKDEVRQDQQKAASP